MDGLATAKIRTTKKYYVWSQYGEGAKIKTTKISSGGDTGKSLHQQKFLAIRYVYQYKPDYYTPSSYQLINN